MTEPILLQSKQSLASLLASDGDDDRSEGLKDTEVVIGKLAECLDDLAIRLAELDGVRQGLEVNLKNFEQKLAQAPQCRARHQGSRDKRSAPGLALPAP